MIVAFTEGTSSPFWAYFVFAVIASGAHGGFRRSLAVTVASVGIYLSLILFAWSGETNVYIVRPVYLAVVGYLTAYLGRERIGLQDEVHRLESARERNRIARALHDGCVQTVGAVTLTLEGVKELLRSGRGAEAETRLTELQASNRELTTALDTQTATSDILRVISRSQIDVQPVFDAIVASAVRLLGAYSGLLTRVAGDQIELAARDPSSDAFAQCRFQRAKLVVQAHTQLEEAMVDRAQFAAEHAPGRVTFFPFPPNSRRDSYAL